MVDSAIVARGGLVKKRSIEKPRPLRTDPEKVCLSDILRLAEDTDRALSEARNDVMTRLKTQQLKELLRLNGQTMERTHKDILDRLEVTMLEASRDSEIDIITRLNVLETIELRLNNWNSNPMMISMYRNKLAEASLNLELKKVGYGGGDKVSTIDSHLNNNIVNITELNNNNNNDKNCEGEDLLKLLLQPQEDLRYSSSLVVDGHVIKISSSSDQFVNTSREVLLEFFSILEETEGTSEGLTKPEIWYEKEELMRLSKSPLCRSVPKDWDRIVSEIPFIAKKEGASSKHFLRELEGIIKQEAARRM